MKTNQSLTVPPFMVFFLIHSMQVGVGVLGFQRVIAKSGGYQSWIAVLFTGLLIHLVVYFMYKILDGEKDIAHVHEKLFGKWLGSLLNIVFMLYYTALAFTVLRTYTEVIQIWVFPDLPTWTFTITMLLLMYLAIVNGFRIVTGVCFLGVVLPMPLLLTTLPLFEFAEFRYLRPLFDTTIREQLMATKDMTLSVLGPELLLIFYPFIRNAAKSQRYAHYAVLYTTFIYLIATISAFVYFSEEQMDITIWPTLSSWKVLELPFIERFEYIGISAWLIVILPNITVGLWASSRIGKRVFSMKHRHTLIISILIVFIASILLETRDQINQLNSIVSIVGLYVLYVYIPFLLVWKWIVGRLRLSP